MAGLVEQESTRETATAVRAASLDVLRRLNESDLERSGEHSNSGRYTLAMWLDIYTEHPRAHAAQLVEAVNA